MANFFTDEPLSEAESDEDEKLDFEVGAEDDLKYIEEEANQILANDAGEYG